MTRSKLSMRPACFQDVKISQSGGRIIVTVVEKPVINRVVFLKATASQGRAAFGRSAVEAAWHAVAPGCSVRYAAHHRNLSSQRPFDVSVTPKIIDQPNNRVDLVFEVNEGAKTGVNSIEFIGNKVYSGARLKDVIKTRESNILSFLGNGVIYDPDRVESDRDLIRPVLSEERFRRCARDRGTDRIRPGKKGFIVTFHDRRRRAVSR